MSGVDPFARLASIYDRVFPRVVPKYDEAVDLMLALLPYGAEARVRLVELGCGTGEVLKRLATAFPQAEIRGVDSSAAMLEVAHKKLSPFAPRVSLLRHDLSQGWPEEVGECEAVLCPYVLEYLAPEAQELLLQGAFRRLKPEGRLLIIEFVQPNEPRISQVFRDLEYRLISGTLARRQLSEEELAILTDLSEKGPRHPLSWSQRVEMLERVGFRRVDTAWRFLNFVLATAARP
jgi:tRNA (cmo5U34)-methyltransferase